MADRSGCLKCKRYSETCYEIDKFERANDCKTTHGRNDTLCWCCIKSVPKKNDPFPCPYATKLLPVKGWDAKEGRSCEGRRQFHVYDCPLFVRGREGFDIE